MIVINCPHNDKNKCLYVSSIRGLGDIHWRLCVELYCLISLDLHVRVERLHTFELKVHEAKTIFGCDDKIYMRMWAKSVVEFLIWIGPIGSLYPIEVIQKLKMSD